MLKKIFTLVLVFCLASVAIAGVRSLSVYDANTKTARLEIGDSNDRVVIGNPDAKEDFQAHVKMEFWGENYISLCEEGVKGTPTLKDEVITLDLANRKLEWFKGSGAVGKGGIGGILHWVETLKSKPASNKWSLKISDDDQFKYNYQTKFADEAAKIPGAELEYFERDGEDWIRLLCPGKSTVERPLEIDGSIAIYHKTKMNHRTGGKNYRTGKVLHIPRPKAVDANNKWAWCDIKVENGVYTRTIPQKFLDEAVYPVIINDTLGYLSIGGSNVVRDAEELICYYIGNMPAAGTLDSIHIYDSDISKLTGAYFGLYSGTEGIPSTRIHISAEIDVDPGEATWHVVAGSSEALGNGLEMYTAASPQFDSDLREVYDTDSYWYGREASTYDVPSTPPDWDSTASDRRVSTYITYTLSAGAAGQLIIINMD